MRNRMIRGKMMKVRILRLAARVVVLLLVASLLPLSPALAADAEKAPLTEAQRQEIDRRLAAHRANPQAAIPWEQVEAEALARLRR